MKKPQKIVKNSLIVVAMAVIVAMISGMLILEPNVHINGYATLDEMKLVRTNDTTTILGSNGILLGGDELSSSKFTTPIAQIPKHTTDAFIAIEDNRFYAHDGVDYYRLLGAFVANVQANAYKEGGSTITQQLVKNTHLSNDKKISRKVQEIRIAKQLERKYTKDQILEYYLNMLYFGNNIYGVANAAKFYFGQNVSDMSISQSAGLAAIINNPSKYNPISNLDNYITRRNKVLGQMQKRNYITLEQYEISANSAIELATTKNSFDNYYHGSISEACQILDLTTEELFSKNLTIHTYFDIAAQTKMHDALAGQNMRGLTDFGNNAVVIDNDSHGIIADASSTPYRGSVTRQPASAIKPIMCYAPALEKKLITPSTPILDEPINYNGYQPINYDKSHKGWMTIEQSLMESNNIAAVKLLEMSGIEYSKKLSQQMGITFQQSDKSHALALGGMTNGTSLKQLTGAYTTFANKGKFATPKYIRQIVDENGSIVYQHSPKIIKVLGEDTAYLMTSMLQKTAENGTARKLNSVGYQIAAKTGTNGNMIGNTDAYCIAYNTAHTIGVWFGKIDSNNLTEIDNQLLGGVMPTIAIRDWSNEYYNNKPSEFIAPKSVAQYDIDLRQLNLSQKLMLAGNDTPIKNRKKVLFAKNNYPSKVFRYEDTVPRINNKINKLDSFGNSGDNSNYIIVDSKERSH